MDEIVNKFLLVGDKFMPEIHLKQSILTYSACGSFTNNRERIQKFKEAEDTDYIYKNGLDKACFQHDIAYGNFKDIARTTASDKVLRDKPLNIAENLKYDGYQRGLASMVYKFFDKKAKESGCPLNCASRIANDNNNGNNNKQNMQLAKELHKPIIRNFKKGTVYSGFKDNIWGADLADMQLISKFNKGFRFLSCVIDIFSKSF